MYILGFMISFGERGMGFLPAKAMSGVWAGRARTEIPRLTPRLTPPLTQPRIKYFLLFCAVDCPFFRD